MLYNWSDANPDVPADRWGMHVAAAPLAALNFRFDANGWVIPIAMNRNSSNPVKTSDGAWVDNGTLDQNLKPMTFAGGACASGSFSVAEGATAFFHKGSGRYYVLYSRNHWQSPAYQIVYRMTEPGQPFREIQLSRFMDEDVQEHVLLRAEHYDEVHSASFGHPEVFSLVDEAGQDRYYVVFHAKMDSSAARTIFLKELTLESTASGRLKQLHERHSDIDRDIRYFRLPVCRQ